MISARELIKAKVARFTTDANNNVIGLAAPDGNLLQVAGLGDPSLPILCVGGDHPYEQWYGNADDGLGKMYRDYGITPYMAINTDAIAGPGSPGHMTWAQVAAIQAGGCEILSHSYRHVHQYGRMDTGIRIRYLGANATATVHVSGTPKTLTLDAETAADASFDLTNASYDTLSELAAAINAVNGGASWAATVAPELTGDEPSASLLALVAARSVKSPSAYEDYFACGSGIIISYTGPAYKTAYVQITSTPTLDIYLDGVRRGTFNLGNASYDSLAELVAAINALALSGLTADLCDDTAGTYLHYTQGDEKSTELAQTFKIDLRAYGGIVPDGSGKSNGARCSAGLPHSYLLERQWSASVDTAAANGITLKNWAQSGGGWHQYYAYGQGFASYRTNQMAQSVFPGAGWAARGPDYIRPHYTLGADHTAAVIKAVIRAMVKTPGCMVDLLCHALEPASPAGVNGYTLPASDSLNVVAEADWLEVLPYIKTFKDAGQLVVLTPEQARRRRKWAGQPQNLIFNPTFENDGSSILDVDSLTYLIPGWEINTTQAHVTAAAVADAGDYNICTFTTDATTNADVLFAPLLLERGKTYRVGARLRVDSISSGYGVQLVVSPIIGGLPDQLPDDASPTWASVYSKADQDIAMLIHVPPASTEKPRVRGSATGPFTITGGSTDTLSIAIDGNTAVAVTLTAGSRTASQVASEINAAFAASATYTSKQEYWAPASVEGNRVVVASPYATEEHWNRLSITGNGAATVFGASQCLAEPGYGGPPVYPYKLRVRGQVIGTWSVIKPYCVEVNHAY